MKSLNIFTSIICPAFFVTFLIIPHLSAADNTSVLQEKADQSEMVHIRWKNLGDGIIYHFQMARDREFQQIIVDQKCERPETAFHQPNESGIYYIRTRPEDINGQAGNFSQVQIYESSVKLRSPYIILPEEISEFRDIHDIEAKWTQVPRATVYHVILARDRTFKYIFYENNQVPYTSLQIGNLDYGTYYIKVCGVSKEGEEGPFSDVRPFIIVPPPPRNTVFK